MNLENIIEEIVRNAVRDELAAVSSPQAAPYPPAPAQAHVSPIQPIPTEVSGPNPLLSTHHPVPASPVPASPVPASPVQLPLAIATPGAGPALVPTLDQIRERLMQLLEAKGEQACISALINHGGQDPSGNVNVSLVPAGQYLPLYTALGSELGAS